VPCCPEFESWAGTLWRLFFTELIAMMKIERTSAATGRIYNDFRDALEKYTG
jgi:hypothetical protein